MRKKVIQLSERNREMARKISDHLLIRLCQDRIQRGLPLTKTVFWQRLKRLMRGAGFAEENGYLPYGIAHLTPKVEALYVLGGPGWFLQHPWHASSDLLIDDGLPLGDHDKLIER